MLGGLKTRVRVKTKVFYYQKLNNKIENLTFKQSGFKIIVSQIVEIVSTDKVQILRDIPPTGNKGTGIHGQVFKTILPITRLHSQVHEKSE